MIDDDDDALDGALVQKGKKISGAKRAPIGRKVVQISETSEEYNTEEVACGCVGVGDPARPIRTSADSLTYICAATVHECSATGSTTGVHNRIQRR